uniref:Uncharacterized protein n=1 Tax=Xiphophorus couchianus TaxID=32473 RepID=A0A3B5LX49_9TELE
FWGLTPPLYGLLRLINITYQLANGTMEELTELRNMVMQNRVVLDFLTAPQGGVCKIIGTTGGCLWEKVRNEITPDVTVSPAPPLQHDQGSFGEELKITNSEDKKIPEQIIIDHLRLEKSDWD